MARQQSQGGFGNQYSGQPNVNDFDQDQADDEHARALSSVREQVRAQLGGQVPAWDGPIPGFWDRVKNQQQYQQAATNNYGQGQPTHDTTRAPQFQAQEQFGGPQQGNNRANWNVPAQGMQQISGRQHTQNGMPGPNFGQGQPATPVQGRNQHDYSPRQPGSHGHSPKLN